MNKEKIDRINALAKKAKGEGLSAEEMQERALLRKEYIEAFKKGTKMTLERVRVENKDGVYVPLKKCSPEEAEKKKAAHKSHHHHKHGEKCSCGKDHHCDEHLH